MNSDSILRGFGGAVLGAILAIVIVSLVRGREFTGRPAGPEPFEVPEAVPRADPERFKAVAQIAAIQTRIADLKEAPREDERRKRAGELARAFGVAAKNGWDSDECRKAEAALGDWLAALARQAGVDVFEFALNPERDALIVEFLAGFGIPLDDGQAASLKDLLSSELSAWNDRVAVRDTLTKIQRLASAAEDATIFERKLGALLTPAQLEAVSHRYEIRGRSRNPRPWNDRNNVLGPREAPSRQTYGAFANDECLGHWEHEILDPDSRSRDLLKFYSEQYEREMLGVEKPDDLTGATTVPPAYRAKQAKIQAEFQRQMMEDFRFTDSERQRIREWATLYDPASSR